MKKFDMSNKFFVVAASLIFLMNLLNFFLRAVVNAQTHMFAICFVICVVLFIIASLIFFKYRPKTLNRLELASTAIALISMLSILLSANGIYVLMRIACYMGYASLLLGGIGYYKYKHKINLSFLAWGLFVLLWFSNLYNAMYLVTDIL